MIFSMKIRSPVDYTFLVKTFNRYDCLNRLLDSIVRLFPAVPIVVVDDSTVKQRLDIFDSEKLLLLDLPADMGVSYGRNRGVEHVSTPYFILLDDDYVLTEKTDIAGMIGRLERDGLSICAGLQNDYGCLLRYWQGTYEIENGNLIRHFRNFRKDRRGVVLYDFAHQFFAARTGDVRTVLWDEKIKIGPEHDDFFIRAWREQLRVSVDLDSWVDHFPRYRMRNYAPFRSRYYDYYPYFLDKHGVRRIRNRAQPLDTMDRIRNQYFRMMHYLRT